MYFQSCTKTKICDVIKAMTGAADKRKL